MAIDNNSNRSYKEILYVNTYKPEDIQSIIIDNNNNNNSSSSSSSSTEEGNDIYVVRGLIPVKGSSVAITTYHQQQEEDEEQQRASDGELAMVDFDIVAFFDALHTHRLGKTLLYSPCMTSTQRILRMRQMSTLLPMDCVCTCDVQRYGIGRGENTWESPRGCLMMSMKFAIANARLMVFVQYLVSLAMVIAIEEIFGAGDADAIKTANVRLKWPNDIYGGSPAQKIGGIICNSEWSSETKLFQIVAGIGINVLNSEPTTCLQTLFSNSNVLCSREVLLAAFLKQFETMLADFCAPDGRGFAIFESAYLARWLHSGQEVTLAEDQLQVRITGLTSSGYLKAVDSNGKECELHPDGNSFDFFQGLIKKKVTNT